MEDHKPRRIRDIAHIYLSRLDRNVSRPPRRVVIAGTRRECLSGFHAAGIAAALSARGCSVRLRELSGLVPNTAFFLALPPQVHLAAADRASAEWYSALGGIALTFSSGTPEPPDGAGAVVELFHAPPGDDAEAHRSLVTRVAKQQGALFVMLDDGDPVGLAGDISVRVGELTPLGVAGAAVHRGRIERWGGSLSDPVPPVLRDPGSMLSRSFVEIGERLLNPVPAQRGGVEGSANEEQRFHRTRRAHRRRIGPAARTR